MYPRIYWLWLAFAKLFVLLACECRDRGQSKHTYMRRRVVNQLEQNLGTRPDA